MSVYRSSKSPYWQFDFQIEHYRFFGSTKLTNKREAEAFEAAERQTAQKLVESSRRSGRGPLTWGAACDRWWSEHGQYLRDASDKNTVEWVKAQIGPKTFLHEIGDNEIAKMVAARRKCRVRAGKDEKGNPLFRPISPTTVNKTICMVSRIVRRARHNWKAATFDEPVWKMHRLKQNKRPVREITAEEDRRLDAVECADYAKLRRFAEINGLRRRALLLTWPQVDFARAVYRIQSKGGKWREIPMTPETYQILWSCRDHHETWVFTFVARRTRRCPHHKTMQIKDQRYPITYYGFSSRKRRTWKAAGVDARIHDLRHTTGMRTLRKTNNLKLVQVLLGHSKISTTADFYTDANLDDLREGMIATEQANPGAKIPEKVPDSKRKQS